MLVGERRSFQPELVSARRFAFLHLLSFRPARRPLADRDEALHAPVGIESLTRRRQGPEAADEEGRVSLGGEHRVRGRGRAEGEPEG